MLLHAALLARLAGQALGSVAGLGLCQCLADGLALARGLSLGVGLCRGEWQTSSAAEG